MTIPNFPENENWDGADNDEDRYPSWPRHIITHPSDYDEDGYLVHNPDDE
jgi:hypothetical protein